MTETQPTRRRFEIKARRDGFRRAGRAWPAKGTVVENLTPEQIEAVLAEPQLIVTELPAPAETSGKDESGEGGDGTSSQTVPAAGDEKKAKPAKPAAAKATKAAEPKPAKTENT
ncbi:HI1506-related protein [Algihabitans albus]|uniref:HI1506-related protein n=1 Tax=Algihabitans albus TaxID=2164067 RepID=UPI000E5C657A|nr:HI1506-related protein [Algihabitans albus]